MSQEIALPEMDAEIAQAPGNLFGTQNPAEVVARSTAIAKALADVLKAKGLAKKISGREFVMVEGWTLLGSMMGVFPVVEWTRPVEGGWEARVEARTLGGQVVGAAEAECLRSEKQWNKRDDYALRSMAQTRAVSKALRGPLGFIVQLAGYSATPAEEIPEDEPKPQPVTAERTAAIDKVAVIFADLEASYALPDGWKSWGEFGFDYIKRQFKAKDLEQLTAEQLEQVATFLEDQKVPV